MIVEPERYLADFVAAGADMLTVHVEACPHLHRTLGLGIGGLRLILTGSQERKEGKGQQRAQTGHYRRHGGRPSLITEL
jgi:hypothetical protein